MVITNTQIEQLTQAMADFETNTGIGWTEAINSNNEEALNIIRLYYSNITEE